MCTVFSCYTGYLFVRGGIQKASGIVCISGGFLIGRILAVEKKNQCWHTARVDWKQRAWRADMNQGGTLMSSKVSIKTGAPAQWLTSVPKLQTDLCLQLKLDSFNQLTLHIHISKDYNPKREGVHETKGGDSPQVTHLPFLDKANSTPSLWKGIRRCRSLGGRLDSSCDHLVSQQEVEGSSSRLSASISSFSSVSWSWFNRTIGGWKQNKQNFTSMKSWSELFYLTMMAILETNFIFLFNLFSFFSLRFSWFTTKKLQQ